MGTVEKELLPLLELLTHQMEKLIWLARWPVVCLAFMKATQRRPWKADLQHASSGSIKSQNYSSGTNYIVLERNLIQKCNKT